MDIVVEGSHRLKVRRTAILVSLVAINCCAIVEKADESVLPAVLINIRESFPEASLTTLGFATFIRAIFQALASPIAGFLGDEYDRTKIILYGCVIWGVAMGCIGLSTNLGVLLISCGCNGIGLSLAIPTITSLLSDYSHPSQRGRVFGMMGFVANMGGLVAAFFATSFASEHHHGGWRLVFITMALVSVVCGVVQRILAVDPRDLKVQKLRNADVYSKLVSMFESLQVLLRIPSFRLIVLQGIVGSMPWVSMSLFTLWLQNIGFSGRISAHLVAIFSVCCALGGVLGGILGDYAASNISQRHGRIAVGQTSIALGIPLSILLCRRGIYNPPLLADGVEVYYPFAVLLALLGLVSSWCGSNNSAIFAEIVPPTMITRVFAFDRTFEGAVGALGAPLVGVIASRVYGFSFDDDSQGYENGRALSQSLMWCLCVPWAICFIFYSLLHRTFPSDRRYGSER
ncbi:hypothetical protein M9435_002507 [Picochlorum sp. BPE23]|nr:hypothetical protein M9435_002507 [Picochlorum sp. BPE23]